MEWKQLMQMQTVFFEDRRGFHSLQQLHVTRERSRLRQETPLSRRLNERKTWPKCNLNITLQPRDKAVFASK